MAPALMLVTPIQILQHSLLMVIAIYFVKVADQTADSKVV
jgi:hypothetical protein